MQSKKSPQFHKKLDNKRPSFVAAQSEKNGRKKFFKRKPLVKEPDEISKSVGAIVLNKRNHTLLVFQEQNQYWEFPKGKTEAGEREIDTLKRELFEETGIARFQMFPHFRKTVYYDFQHEGRVIRREVVYFLIRTNDVVHISDEHTEYMWLPLKRAQQRLKHENQVRLLQSVMQRLNPHVQRKYQR